MPINNLNSKLVKFSDECKKYDGKCYHIEAYEKFVLNILKPRKFKLGLSSKQLAKGLKPETYLIPPMTIEDSWNYVNDKYKIGVIKLLIDLCNRYENSVTKKIPIILTGSSNTYILNRKHNVFISFLKKFLIQKKFVNACYFLKDLDIMIKSLDIESSIRSESVLKPSDINSIVNEMMIFTMEDI